jgi:hydrogenase maturation protease
VKPVVFQHEGGVTDMIFVIGIGTPDHGDDAAGLLVADRIRAATSPRTVTVRELVGDQLGLLDLWTGAREVYVVDAVCSGGPPGAVYRFDGAQRLSAQFMNPSTHAFSLADVIELARAMDRMPPRLIGYGIEGTHWELGATVSPQVMGAVDVVTRRLCLELRVGA